MKYGGLVLMFLVACGDDGATSPDAARPDARVPDTALPDAPPAIAGTAVNHYVEDSGIVDLPRDLTGWMVSSTLGAGSVGADGTFTFPIPDGATSWLWTTVEPTYMQSAGYVSTSLTPDLGISVLGRPDVTFPNLETDVTFAVTGLASWDDTSDIELFCANAGGFVYGLEYSLPIGIVDGDTSIEQVADWSQLLMPAIDSSVGDRLSFAQVSNFTANGDDYAAIARYGVADPVTIAQSQAATITAALTAPETETFSLDWKGDAFEALRAGAGPYLTPNSSSQFLILATPHADTEGLFGSSGTLVAMSLDGTEHADTLTYANPYTNAAGPWIETAYWSYSFFAHLRLGTAPYTSLPLSGLGWRPVSQLASGVVTPALSGVQHPTIGGQDATVAATLTAVGAAPTIAWDPPAIGTATSYTVNVYHLQLTAGVTDFVPTGFLVTTKATSLALPVGLLQAGEPYFATIIAQSGTVDLTSSPLRNNASFDRFESVTSEFTP